MALPRDPGSTANTAYDIGNLGELQTLSEFIGATDSTDIYKFSLTETSDFSLTVDEYSGYWGSLGAYLYIDLNQNGQIDDDEYLYGDEERNLEINSTLDAANYFVSINRREDNLNTNYNFSLSATPSPSSIDTDPGNSSDTAFNIGNLAEEQTFTEFIGSTDSTDIYKFSLTETSDFSLTVDEYSGYWGSLGAYLYIDLNQNGQIDDDEYLYGDEERNLEINSTLDAANYFVSINRREDNLNTNYNLSLAATPSPSSVDTDPGSNTDEAYEIQYLNLDTSEDNRSFTEFIGSTDTRDIYKFSLAQITDINIKVDEYSGYWGSLGAYLYIDLNQNSQIDDGEYLYGDEERNLEINQTLDAADYFLSINRREDNLNTNYNLNITSIADPVSSVSVTAQDAEAKEEGTNAGKFRITRDGDTSAAYTVNYEITTGAGQATNGVDYEELSGSVTIPAQESFVDLFVTPIDERIAEINESVTITLREVDGDLGTGTSQTATITIEDNDEPPTFTIETSEDEASEDGNTGTFRIRSDGDNSQPQTIEYEIATGDDYGINGVDYEELSGSVIIPAEQDYVDLTITPLDDSDIEGTEKLTITVKDINGNPGTADNQTATINIKDNDAAALLSSPIYRFQNSDISGTYLLAGEQERGSINDNFDNFEEEGMAFKVATEAGDDLIPIYRFQNKNLPGIYLFVGEEERQGINQNFSDTFAEEGLAFYVYGAGEDKGTMFYRFQNSAQPGTYLFVGPSERETILNNYPQFVEEGAAFEVGV